MRTRSICTTLILPLAAFALAAADPQQALTNERIFDALGVREGSTVCEIGAGSGGATLAAAKAVGRSGRVYSNELGDRVNALREAVERSGMRHITVVAAGATTTNFPDAGCDAVFMRDVYHHLTDPAAMNLAMLAALKPGGRAALVDFAPPPDSEAPSPADRGKDGMHGITAESMLRELDAAGFERVQVERPGERWFMVVVAKPGA